MFRETARLSASKQTCRCCHRQICRYRAIRSSSNRRSPESWPGTLGHRHAEEQYDCLPTMVASISDVRASPESEGAHRLSRRHCRRCSRTRFLFFGWVRTLTTTTQKPCAALNPVNPEQEIQDCSDERRQANQTHPSDDCSRISLG